MRSDLSTHPSLNPGATPYVDPWYRFARVIELVERHVPNISNATWLDLGSEVGQFLKLVQRKHRIQPTGIDNFDRSNVVEVCHKYFGLDIDDPDEVLDSSWRYVSRSLDKTGIALNEQFDFISALEILEHMTDTDAFLRDCRGHLRDGGHLVLSTPNINSLRNRIQVPLGIYPAGLEYRNIIHHVRLYNVPTLEEHLREHGFEVVAISGVNFLPARLLSYRFFRRIDAVLADRLPRLCGTIMVLSRRKPEQV